MLNVKLNGDVDMPILGFGVYQIAPDETEKVVMQALETGYRSLDTAAAYGNEAAVGRAIAASGIPRRELFITTKLWVQDDGKAQTPSAFARSMDNLGLEYLDLYLIHQPFGDYYGEWRAMQELHRDGHSRAIGVCNFAADRLVDLVIHHGTKPAVNQIETHPFRQNVQYQQLMQDEGIQLESWGPFAEGRNNLFTDPTLSNIAERHGKSVAQVVLRWMIQRGVVVIPKTVSPERMAQNFDVFDFVLSPEDMLQVAGMDTGESLFFDHRDPHMVRRLGGHRLT